MKKLIIGVLGICLLIGIPFIIMDMLALERGPFNIPSGYEKIKISLSEKVRDNEIVYTKKLKAATEVNLFMQSDSKVPNMLRITSDKKLIGYDTKEQSYEIRDLTGKTYISAKLLLQPGVYTITVTNDLIDGDIMLGYKETKINDSEYERLLKIAQGDLNNPPEGYELIYNADLSGLNLNKETVYTVTLDQSQRFGIAAYTNSSKGNVSVDLIGQNSSYYYGLVSSGSRYFFDKREETFQAGDYKIQLTSENADGQIYIFIKK